MAWITEQPSTVKKNAEIIVKRLNAKGITNPFAQAGILAIASKESSLVPKSEKGYGNTDNARIRKIFGQRVAEFSEAQLSELKKDTQAFFNHVYGSKFKTGRDLGNDQPGDGYKYRGRGLNQITGKAKYRDVGNKIGVDLINNPDLMTDVAVATDAMIEFFRGKFSKSDNKLSLYNSTGLNDFKNIQDATNAYYHANTGWGKSQEDIKRETTGGYAKAVQRGPEFLDYVTQFTGQTIDLAKKKPGLTILVTAVVIISVYALYKVIKNK